jgi:hypothetical protein
MEERESRREEAYRAERGGQGRLNREGRGETGGRRIPYLFISSVLSLIL